MLSQSCQATAALREGANRPAEQQDAGTWTHRVEQHRPLSLPNTLLWWFSCVATLPNPTCGRLLLPHFAAGIRLGCCVRQLLECGRSTLLPDPPPACYCPPALLLPVVSQDAAQLGLRSTVDQLQGSTDASKRRRQQPATSSTDIGARWCKPGCSCTVKPLGCNYECCHSGQQGPQHTMAAVRTHAAVLQFVACSNVVRTV